MQEFLNSEWFTIFGQVFTFGQILYSLAYVFLCITIYWYFAKRFLPKYFEKVSEEETKKGRVYRTISYIFYLSLLTGFAFIFNLDPVLFSNAHITFKLSTLFQAILIAYVARVADWVISGLFLNRFYNKRDDPKRKESGKKESKESAGRIVQIAVYLFAAILILTSLNVDYKLYDFTDSNENITFSLRISNILAAILGA